MTTWCAVMTATTPFWASMAMTRSAAVQGRISSMAVPMRIELTGGTESDTFVVSLQREDGEAAPENTATITDFVTSGEEEDLLQIFLGAEDSPDDLSVTADGADAIISLGEGADAVDIVRIVNGITNNFTLENVVTIAEETVPVTTV